MALTAAALTEAQQEIRSTGIGASEIAAVVGLSPYKGPIDIWARKLRLVEDDEAGEPARWGLRLEQVIAEAYAEEEGLDPALLVSVGTLRHPEHPVALCTPDRIRLQRDVVPARGLTSLLWDRNVQVKTASLRVADRWGQADDDVPEEYLVQVQYEMAVTGLDRTDLPVLIGGNEMRIYRLHADTELQASLIEAAERFWRDHIERREPPPVDGSDRYAEYLAKRFPKDSAPVLAPTDDAIELVSSLRAAKAATKAAEEAERLVSNRLRAAIGEAAGIDGLCTYKLQKGSTYTVTREPGRVLRLAKERN